MGSRYHGIPLGTLVNMAFNRNDPNQMVAASPFTGVFYGTWPSVPVGQCAEPNWRDLSNSLPTPIPYASSLAMDDVSIYVGTEGRGLLRIDSPGSALLATYFESRSIVG